ncbi:hypothetical protein JDV02_009439 [Purpureocillium takamizusanense]|uniref:Uncharacterized protein n=1 Tax=Purpureocillium takamizusanense TaxID=2060973 RepID=A0A9Q8QSF1_9HYPO|nr:uncharacterized protein JDV02_009439 [Purpureocillium takamizusanense]UNI23632.1 hypothetical protein JDV02_009439 [Purpureocillium takamizusanense]
MPLINFMRRNLVLSTCVAMLVMVFLFTQPSVDAERLRNMIPHRPSTPGSSNQNVTIPDHVLAQSTAVPPASTESPSAQANASGEAPKPGHQKGTKKVRTSQLHYLIPASRANVQLCYNLVSSAVNRYPVPTLLGWNGAGEFDAAVTHLAKLRAMQRYLRALQPQEDKDLVLIVDGYDIIQQLPPEVIIERYFDIAAHADVQLAERFGISTGEARERNLRQTIFWGPDKICFPMEPRAPRCWAAPPSSLGPHAFGPASWTGDMIFADPRWLNSGTVIGPVDDVRRLIDATMDEIDATHNPEYEFRESDQYYISNVWARQEYWRSKTAAKGGEVPGGPPDRVIPDKRSDGQDTEFHASIEYESALFQTKAGYEPFIGYLQFNESGLAATMNVDMFGLGDKFAPFTIPMPENVHSALTKLYDSIPEAHPGQLSSDWIRTVNLGVNYVTKHIYGLWHCTGPKEFIDREYPTFWWYPFVKSLLKAAVRSSQSNDLITSRPIDGRMWVAKTRYPDDEALHEEYGGAWSDEVPGGMFVPWSQVCGPHEELLFRGEQGPILVPASPPSGPLVRRVQVRQQW